MDAAVKDAASMRTAKITILKLDMNSLTSVREAAAKVNVEGKPVHVRLPLSLPQSVHFNLKILPF